MRSIILLALAALTLTAADPREILLWPNGAPGSGGKTAPETLVKRDDGLRRVATIHKPSITLPPARETDRRRGAPPPRRRPSISLDRQRRPLRREMAGGARHRRSRA